MSIAIEIRTAREADLADVRRLAERDTASVPAGELLLALEAGRLRAARSESGEVIADPFAPTAALVSALEAAAERRRPKRTRARAGATSVNPGLAR